MTMFTTNIIETNQQDGSVKCVLGSIVENTQAKLSRKITKADGAMIVRLAEDYSVAAIVEYMGRHILSVAAAGRKTHKNEKAEVFYALFDKIGIALYASSIAINALAATGDEAVAEAAKETLKETEEDFLARLKVMERKLARKDGRDKK